ncbi:MAG: hypothetical protein IJI58_05980 [Bacilli bacterium]|nr:hypothetical protein [Bacilli bacterium]
MKKNKKVIIAVCLLIIVIVGLILFVNSKNSEYLYQSNHNKSHIGMRVLGLKGTHKSYKDIKKNVFLRHKVEKGVIVSTEIGFKYHDQIYYLKGADQGDSYEQNKQVLEMSFGKDNCEEGSDLNSYRKNYSCFGEDGYSSAYTVSDGAVGANIEDDWNCSIVDSEIAYCYREYEDE